MALVNSTLLIVLATLLLTIISKLKLASGACRVKGHCSPPVTDSTSATLTLNDFSEGGDGGGQSECDNRYHSNSEKVIALSTGWYNDGSRCGKNIRIKANGKSVLAKVVDECDVSTDGCKNNIVDASQAVWDALGLDSNLGVYHITWSDA